MSEFAFDVSIEEFEAKVLIPAETVPVSPLKVAAMAVLVFDRFA